MSTSDTLVTTATDATFAQDIEATKGVVMVDFWAPWCGPCRAIAPTVEALAKEYEGRARVAKLNTDENPATMQRFGVRSIPSILFFKDGVLVDKVVGALPRAALEQKLVAQL